MISGDAVKECKFMLFSSPIYPYTHQPFNFFSSKGWMSRHGHVLKPAHDEFMVCPESGFRYKEISPGTLKCLDLSEEVPLPEKLTRGKEDYRQIKAKSLKVRS